MTTILERYPHLVKVQEVPTNPLLGPCWEWTGTKTPDGYGKVTIRGRKLLAHRVAHALAFGELAPGILLLHQCNNPACCRQEGPGGNNHLKPGTHADNMAQAWAEGRIKKHARGVRRFRRR
jgi:hypothetical protein